MKVSREKMAQNRAHILKEASQLFRSKGFDAVSVAEVMKAAGLTHGGFYGHFASKDDLFAHSVAQAFDDNVDTDRSLRDFRANYLSEAHRANPGSGCPMAALAVESGRQDGDARIAMTQGIETQIATVEAALECPGTAQTRQAAIGQLAAMVGAMILARASADADLSAEILNSTRAWLDADA
ncbi:TetR family transcriptional regulator [Celeribacter baekdonensis]|uniref:TetR/AcrR family transcriptional regulator n=1 Tax=Celeribacter baekdonensis TaxID=875171 RepID=UPI0030DD5A36|tara:strand:- start:122707 stop:123252 length:546 start_codon:yes stop_codon:yes gene_type:complete